MEDLSTIARPYAQAILAQADSEKQFAQWSDMLGFLASAVRDPALSGIISNPSIDGVRLTELLLQVSEGRLSDSGANLVRVLVENRRVGTLPQIAEQYESGRAELEGRRQVEIVSAFKLTAKQTTALTKAISERLGRKVDVEVSIDNTLLGGVVIRAGDTVIDASMRGKLAQLGTVLGVSS